MKPIKIAESNRDKIEKALAEVNGKATEHTYKRYEAIAGLALEAEKHLGAVLDKKDWPGATMRDTSGGTVANRYRGTRIATEVTLERRASGWFLRIATEVTLERRASGWFLVNIKRDTIWNRGGGRGYWLTQAQDEAAHKRLRRAYHVVKDSQ